MKRGPLYVLICYIIWGICPIYWHLLQNVNAYFILANRIIWSLAIAFFIVLANKQRKQIKTCLSKPSERLKLFAAGLFCVLNWGSYIIAVNTQHIVDASLAYFMHPMIAIAIGALFFHEHLAPLQWIGVAMACIGISISVFAYGHIPWLALIIGGTFAIFGAIQKTTQVHGTVALTLQMLWFLLPALLFCVLAPHYALTSEMTTLQWILLPTTGIITAVPLFFYSIGIATTDYALSGILMYVNPTLQLCCGVLLYGESISPAQKWTFIFVWIGLVFYLISSLARYKKQRLAAK